MTCDFLWCRCASMERSVEQRYAVKFCFRLWKFASETFELIKQVHGDDALSHTRVFEWHKMFKEDPTTVRTDPQVAKVKTVLDSDRRLTIV